MAKVTRAGSPTGESAPVPLVVSSSPTSSSSSSGGCGLLSLPAQLCTCTILLADTAAPFGRCRCCLLYCGVGAAEQGEVPGAQVKSTKPSKFPCPLTNSRYSGR